MSQILYWKCDLSIRGVGFSIIHSKSNYLSFHHLSRQRINTTQANKFPWALTRYGVVLLFHPVDMDGEICWSWGTKSSQLHGWPIWEKPFYLFFCLWIPIIPCFAKYRQKYFRLDEAVTSSSNETSLDVPFHLPL